MGRIAASSSATVGQRLHVAALLVVGGWVVYQSGYCSGWVVYHGGWVFYYNGRVFADL